MCIERRKQMVTTSYVAPEMQALDGEAREKGLTILNEIGVRGGQLQPEMWQSGVW